MPVKFKDYYDLLGLDRNASQEDIKQAYRKLARQNHPDVNPGDKSAEDRFKDINEAYAALSDPQKRRQYDQLGSNWRADSDFTPPPRSGNGNFNDFGDAFGGAGGSGDFSDFFESLFGRRGRARAGAGFNMGGRDIEAMLELTLQEAHRGGTRTIAFQRTETCPDCGGTGSKDGRTCPTCKGAGQVRRQRTLEVTVPMGVRDGSVIRLAGQGEPGANGEPSGDLLLEIRIEPDPAFAVVGQDDIETELPIAPWEAALGKTVKVPTLDGQVEMTIPAGAQNGQRLRLRGKGLRKRDGKRGDQFVRLKIVMPPKLTAKEKELFSRLATESHFNPRGT